MKTLNITYDTTEIGKCDPISMMHIELVLQGVELLQGRKIVLDSIKHFELVKE